MPEPAAQLRRRALEQFPVPMTLFDQDGLAVSATSAMEAAPLGRPESDLVGRQVGESGRGLRRLPGFEGIDEAVVRVLRTGEPMPYEAWLRVPGEPREHAWLVSLSPLRDDAGGPFREEALKRAAAGAAHLPACRRDVGRHLGQRVTHPVRSLPQAGSAAGSPRRGPHLFNRFMGMLFYCLQHGQLYDELKAFPIHPDDRSASAA
ncbi:PAS domain-containing protein [Streptomyces coacervatus]|nr:PAS domain-containing protein [Streptomyces coacervatus]MDF2268200.1 PAS domain-containing protein [Streptomyces coacervatus]